MTKAREIAELGQKLTVDASGNLDIAGDITSDGLTVDATESYIKGRLRLEANGAASQDLRFSDTSSTDQNYQIRLTSGNLAFQTQNDNFSGAFTRATFGGTGDISFYDTSGNEKFTWDASASSLGIGTTSPSSQDTSANNFVIHDTAGNGGLTIVTPTNAIGGIHFSDGTSGADRYRGIISYSHSENSMRFHTDTARAMTIDSLGRVGIGNSIPSSFYTDANDLVVGSASGSNGMTIYTSTTGVGAIYFADGTTGSDEYRGGIAYAHDASDPNENLALVSGGETKMRIRTTGYAELASASQIRLTLGNAGTAGSNTANWIRGTAGALGLNAASDNIHFEIGGTERMRIDGSNVGIGVTNVTNPSSRTALQVSGGVSGGGLYLNTSTTDTENARVVSDSGGSIYIATATTGTNTVGFFTSNNERARFDSSGNFLVGHTAESTWASNNGATLRGTGVATLTSTSTPPLYVTRRGDGSNDNGNIVVVRNNDSNIGSLGHYGNAFYISGSGTLNGLMFNGSLEPTRETARVDNVMDIGSNNYRFKNLYLSGGAYIGGTGSANYLDDYEEGTWTPRYTATTGGNLGGTQTSQGKYTKVGNLVTVTIYLFVANISVSGQSGSVDITGLPFTVANNSSRSSAKTTTTQSTATFGTFSNAPSHAIAEPGTTKISLFKPLSGNAEQKLTVNDFATAGGNRNYVSFSISYRV